MRRVVIGGVAGVCAVVGIHRLGFPHLTAVHAGSQGQGTTPSQGRDQASALAAHSDSPSLKLIQVQVFFRHGARTPLSQFEGIIEPVYDKNFLGRTIPHTEIPHNVICLTTGGPQPRSRMDERQMGLVFKGGMSSGQLTSLGRHQLYILGTQLREQYVDKLGFIPEHFHKDDIYVRSTNVKRTIASLECVLAGLYGADKIKEPVTIPVMHMYHEYLYPNPQNCDLLRLIRSTYNHQLMSIPEYVDVVKKVHAGLGSDEFAFIEMMKVRDHVVSMKAHGLNVPSWLEDLYADVEKAAALSLKQFVTGGKRFRELSLKLVSGPMCNLIKENVEEIVKDKSSVHRFHLYSCHDTSLFPLLEILGQHNHTWPPYAADIRFELYESTEQGKHWVKVLFCGKEMIPDGFTKSLLTLEEFMEVLKPYVLTRAQYENHCKDPKIIKEFEEFWGKAKIDKSKSSDSTPRLV